MESHRTSSLAGRFLAPALLAVCALSCAHGAAKSDPKPVTAGTIEPKPEELSASEQIQKLRERITDLETRITALNEKINLESGGQAREPKEIAREIPSNPASNLASSRELPIEPVHPAPAHAKVVPTSKTPITKSDDSSSFVQDENVDRFREAKILYDSARYADATVEFVSFTKESPDHPLAPAAQYYVGMGYLKQKEYARAEEEFNRGLVAYPHSNFVPDTLLALLEASIAQKKSTRVTYYQQKLLGTFPNSPQAVRAALLANRPETTSRVEAPRSEPSIEKPEAPTAPVAPASGQPEKE